MEYSYFKTILGWLSLRLYEELFEGLAWLSALAQAEVLCAALYAALLVYSN